MASNLWVAVGSGGNTIATSSDALVWTGRGKNVFIHYANKVAYANNLWVAVGYGGNAIATSTDGITWTGRGGTAIFNSGGQCVAYGNGLWVAVGGYAGNTIATSTDGITWTARSNVIAQTAYGVVYGNGLWVAVGYALSASLQGVIATSTDGITWIHRNISNSPSGIIFNTEIYDVAFGKDASGNNLWIAVGGNINVIATSSDGINWIGRGACGFSFRGSGIAYGQDGSGNGLWVAVASSGGYTYGFITVATSTNGINWTARVNASVFPNAQKVSYGIDGTGNKSWIATSSDGSYLTSTNGINWTKQTSPTVSTIVYVSAPNFLETILSKFSVPTKTMGDATFTIIPPTSNSTGTFTYTSSNTAVATIAESTITIVGAGTSTITAIQAQTATQASKTITATLTVGKGVSLLSNFSVPAKTVGDAAFTLVPPTSNSTGAFTYASSNTAVATIAGDTITIVGAGIANITATQATDANYLSKTITTTFAVNTSSATVAPTITDFSVPAKIFGDSAFTLTTPTSDSDGAFTYTSSNVSIATVVGNVITITGVGTTTITATQTGTDTYLSGTISATLEVSQATTVLTNFSVATKTFGDASFSIITPTTNSNGSIVYSSSDTTVATIFGSAITIVGGGTTTITASQEGNANYTAATTTTTFLVNPKTPTLSFTIPQKFYSDAPFMVAPTTDSNGTFTYTSSDTTVATVAGSTITLTGKQGTSTITAIQASTANYTSATISTTLNVAGLIVAVGQGGNTIATSADGITWTGRGATIFYNSGYGVAYGLAYGNGLWVAVGSAGVTTIATSTDGKTWTSRGTATTNFGDAGGSGRAVAYGKDGSGNNLWVATGTGITSSPDGITWTRRDTTELASGRAVAYGKDGSGNGFWVATGTGNNATIMTSPNGISWTISTATFGAASGSGYGIAYANGLWVVVGYDRTGSGHVRTSTDGTNWTSRTLGGLSQGLAVAYGKDGSGNGLWVAVGQGSSNIIATSPNGITWTGRGGNNLFDSGAFSVIYSNNTWIIGGYGSVNTIATSTDGITWTGRGKSTFSTVTNGIQGPVLPVLNNFSVPLKNIGDAPFNLVAPTSESTGAITYTSSNTDVATVVGNTVSIVGIGTSIITATQATIQNYLGATITATLTVENVKATLSDFSVPAKTFGDAPFDLVQPTSNSAASFSYTSSNTAVATVAGNTVTIVGGGTAIISANQANSVDYGSATITATLTVSQATNVLSGFAVATKTFGDASFNLVAPTTNSNGSFVYSSSDTAVATVAGNRIIIVGGGTATITASQASTANYTAATTTATFTVNQKTAVLSGFTIATKTFGNAAFSLTNPVTNSNGAFTYTSSDTTVATVAGSTVTIVGGGTATITANQASTTNYTSGTITATFTVNKATTVLSNFTIAAKTYEDVPFTITPPTSNSSGAFTYTSSDTTVATISGNVITLNLKVATITITATQASTSNYLSASITTTLQVVRTFENAFWVSVGSGANTIATSTDGITWTGQGASTLSSGSTVAYGNKLWAVGGNTIATSVDGILWTKQNIPFPQIFSLTYQNNLWVAGCNGGIATSPDAITWTTRTTTVFGYSGANVCSWIAYGNNLWVAVGGAVNGGGGNTIATSPDAITWTGRGATIFNQDARCVAYGNGLWVAVGRTGNTIATSTNGTTWTGRGATVFTGIGNGVAYANNLWVAVGSGGNSIATSTDGITWTGRGNFGFANSSGYNVAYGTDVSGNKLWVALGQFATGTNLVTSIDGITWTRRGSFTGTALSAPTYTATVMSNFTIPLKNIDNAPFNLVSPTTNSDATITYTSSNTSVATIAGSTITIVGIGTSTITAKQANTPIYTSATIATTLTVENIKPTLGEFSVPPKTFGDAPFDLVAPTSNSSAAFSYTSSNTAVATVTNNIVTIVGAGTATITANQANSVDYGSATTSATLTVDKKTTVLSNFSVPVKTFGNGAFNVVAPTTNSNATIVYTSSNTAVATIVGSTITIVGAGTATITASQASNTNFTASSIESTLTVSQATTVLSGFTVPAKTFGNAPFTVVAPTTNSNGSIVYSSSDPTVATIAGTTITIVGGGTATITASQAGTTNYTAATTTATLTVNKATTTLSAFTVPAKIYGVAPFAIVQPTTNSTVSIVYSSSNTAVATIDGNVVTIVGGGSSTITASQATNQNYTASSITATLTVSKATTVLSGFSVPVKTFGDASFSLVAPTTNSNGTIVYTSSNTAVATIAGSVITIIAPGTSTITANQATTTNYTAASTTSILTVSKAAPTLSAFSVPLKRIGNPAFNLVAPTSNSTGSFTYTSSNTAVATISGSNVTIVGIGTSTITATQATTANYLAASTTAVLTVENVTPTITNFSVPTKTLGDASFTLITPTSNSTGTFSYTSSDTSVATIAGNMITIVGAGTSTITAIQAATTTYVSGSITSVLTVNKITPVISGFSIPTKNLTSPVFALVAPTSTSTGVFSYASSNTAIATIVGNMVTIVGGGTCTITATQETTATHATGTITANLTVNAVAPKITNFSIPISSLGNPPFVPTPPTSNSTGAFTYASSNTEVATTAGNVITIVGLGTSTITATQASTASYLSGTATTTLTVRDMPTITNFSIPTKTFGDLAFELVAPTSNSTGAFTYTSSNTAVATIAGNVVSIVSAGTTTITATITAAGNYGSGTITTTLTVEKGTPTITGFSVPAKTFGDASFSLVAPTSNSTGSIVYSSSNTAVATVVGTAITVVSAGTTTITATQATTTNYLVGTATATLTINKLMPTLTGFTVPTKTFGNAPFALVAPSSNSAGSIVYSSSNTAVATIVGNMVTIVGGGTSTITATQATTANYLLGTATATLLVNKIAPTLSNFSVPDKSMGSSAFVITPPTTNSDGVFTYTSSNSSVATIIGDRIRVTGIGSATITATQATSASYFSGTITATMQVSGLATILSILPIPPKTFGDIPFKILGSSNNSGSPIVYTSSDTSVLTIVGDIATIVGGGPVTITASQEGFGGYGFASITYDLQINKLITNLVNFFVPLNTVGNAPFTLVPPISNRTGSYVYTSSNTDVATIAGNTVTIVGAGISTITATQTGTTSYESGTITATLTVVQAIPTITGFSVPEKIVGDAPFSIIAPTSNSPGAFTYVSSNLGIATIAGSTITIVGTGTCTISAIQAGTTSYTTGTSVATFVVNKATTVLTNFSVPTKIFGSAPFTIVPPTTNSNGPITYTSSDPTVATVAKDVITLVGIGTTTITVNQPSTVNYTAGTTTATLTVSKGAPTMSNFVVPMKTFGDEPFSLVAPRTNGDGSIVYTSSNTSVATIDGTTITIVGAGTSTITATQAETTSFDSATITATLQVNKITTLLSGFTVPSKTFGDSAFSLTAPTTNGDGSIVYTSSNAAVATVAGTTITIVGGGNATITATHAGTTNYTSATITAILQVNQQRTTIGNFVIPAKTIGDDFFSITQPTTNSNGLITYTSSNPAVATIDENIITIVGLGSSVITATQASTANYTRATIESTLTVSMITTVLSNFVIPTKNIGDAPFNLEPPTTNSSGTIIYTSSNGLVATIAGDILTIVGTGTCTITATQASTPNSTFGVITASLVVNKALPNLQNFNIPDKIFGDAPFTITAPTTNGNGPIIYTSSDQTVARILRNVITIVGVGTSTITATQPETVNYMADTISDNLSVSLATPTITNFVVPTKNIGDAPFELVAPLSNSTGSFTYTSSDEEVATINGNMVTIVGGGIATITATQDETENFTFGDIEEVLTVNKIPTVLGDLVLPQKTFGDEDFSLVPPTSNSDGEITYTSSDESVAVVDETGFITILGGGNTTITALQASTSTYRSATVTALLRINKLTTTLSDFSVPTKIIGDPTFTIDPPNTNSNGEMVYISTNPSVATIEGDVITIVGLGNTTIIARQLETSDYTLSSISSLFQVKLIRTTLSNFVIPTQTFGGSSFTLTPPTTNSSGAFSYTSSNLLVATVAGNVVTIVGTGTCAITALQESTENSTSAKISSTLAVNRATNTINSFSIPETSTDVLSFIITPPTTSSPGAFTYTCSDPAVATIARNVVSIVGTGTATITATQAATVNFTSATITATLTVGAGSPGLKNFIIPAKTMGDEPFTLVPPMTKSNGAITYTSSDTTVATVNGNTITILAPGTSTITATQENTAMYASTSTTALLTVNKITTALTNFSIPAKIFGDAPTSLVAPTTNSDGAITYSSSNTSVATIDNNIVSIVGGGSAIITATQASSTNYTSASVSALLQVNLAKTIISNFSVPAKIIGEAPFSLVAPTTNGDGAFTYTSTNPAVATVEGNTVTIVGLGSTTIIAYQARTNNYTSATISAPFQVSLITTVLSDFSIPTKVPGDEPFALVAPTSNSTGAFTYTSSNALVATVAGSTVTIVGVGTALITALQASTPNSTIGKITASLVVNKTVATLTNFSVPEKVFGNAPFALVAPTTNSNGSFTYTSSDTTVATITRNIVSIVGVGTTTITANLPSTVNYTSGSVVATLTVGPGSPGLNTFAVAAKTFGDVAFATIAPRSSSDGAFTYACSNTDIATVEGNTITIVGAGTTTITATQESTTRYTSDTITASLQVNKAMPVQTDFSLPSKAAGDAAFTITPPTSNSDGAFTYTSSNIAVATINGDVLTVIGGGKCTITATQAETTNFLSKTITCLFEVSALTTVLSNFGMPTRAVGHPSFAITPPITNGDGAFTYTSSNTAVATIAGNMVSIVGAGTTTITARQASTSNYSAATITSLFIVNRGLPTLSFTMPVKEIGMADFAIVNPVSPSTGEFTYVSGNTQVATVYRNTVSIKAIGTVVFTVSQAMTNNYIAATATASFTVNQKSPTITGFSIPATANVGDKTIKIKAPKSSSISPFTYISSDQTVLKVAKDVITIVGAGTATITGTQAATKTFGPGVVSGTMQVNKKTTFLSNFSVFPKITGSAPFTIFPPITTGNGAFTYTSSNPDVATIVGNVITVVGAGTTTITANQASTVNFTAASITTIFTVNLPNPVVGTLPIANKLPGDSPFTIADPSKPANSTSSWVYASSNTDVATISGNEITLVQPGITTIIATLPGDSLYNSAMLKTQFSVSDPLSTFAFITSSTIASAIPATVQQVRDTVIPATVATPINIEKFNPKLGTVAEKLANRFMVVDTLLNMFSKAITINIPTTLLYVPVAFNRTKLKNIKLIRPYGVDTTLVINTVASDSSVAYVCSILEVGNGVRVNGVGAMAGNFIVIVRAPDNKYMVARTTKANVTTSAMSLSGDIITFGGMSVMII